MTNFTKNIKFFITVINTLMKRTKSESADRLESVRQKIREKYRRLSRASTPVPHYEDKPEWYVLFRISLGIVVVRPTRSGTK